MCEAKCNKPFRVAVSDKADNRLGTGGTSRRTARQVYFFAERDEQGNLYVQPLNDKYHPAGERRSVTLEEFLNSFRPEPLFYYNRVLPAMEGVESCLEKGDRHLEANRAELASKSYKRALETDENNVRGIFGLGLSYLAQGLEEDAEAILGRLMGLELAFDPAHSHLFNQFGIQLRKTGMLEQALEYYNKALSLCGQDEHLHFNVCRIHYAMGDNQEALRCLDKALELNSGFGEGLKMRAYLMRCLDGGCTVSHRQTGPSETVG